MAAWPTNSYHAHSGCVKVFGYPLRFFAAPNFQGMRDAPDKEKEYKEIEHRWNVKAFRQ